MSQAIAIFLRASSMSQDYANVELPRLRVVARRCQHSVLKTKSQTVGNRIAGRERGFVNLPKIGGTHVFSSPI